MNNHDWERFGQDIQKTIQDAVQYGNYDRLNQTITNTVNKATNWMANHQQQQPKYQQQQQPKYQPEQYQKIRKVNAVPKRYKSTTFSKIGAFLCAFFGCFVSAIFGLVTLVGVIGTLGMGELISAIVYGAIMLLFMSGFLFLAYSGITNLARVNRFEKYVKEVGNAELCNISELAIQVSKEDSFVVKDLEKMINKGWFLQGHLDRQKTCLIVTHQMYQRYKQIEKQRDLQQQEAEDAAQKKAENRSGLSPEVQKVITQGDAYVRKIRECNDAIPGEEISEKIYRIEVVVDKIFDRVEQNPESVSDVRKLMDYYLPTTVKLLEAYAQMDAQPVGGPNIENSKKEIEATLDTLNVAFEKLLDSLFQDAAWDVSSDISVLNNMLAQEGLKDDGLKK